MEERPPRKVNRNHNVKRRRGAFQAEEHHMQRTCGEKDDDIVIVARGPATQRKSETGNADSRWTSPLLG